MEQQQPGCRTRKSFTGETTTKCHGSMATRSSDSGYSNPVPHSRPPLYVIRPYGHFKDLYCLAAHQIQIVYGITWRMRNLL